MSFEVNLGPCGCCGECEYIECLCCPANCNLVSTVYQLTFDDFFTWDAFLEPEASTTSLNSTITSSVGCLWTGTIASDSGGAPPEVNLECCAGRWIVSFVTGDVQLGSCGFLFFEIEADLCCIEGAQEFDLVPLTTADLAGLDCVQITPCSGQPYDGVPNPFSNFPTKVTISTSCSCQTCPTCCNAPRPDSVFMEVLTTGTGGCECIGTVELPWDADSLTWSLFHADVCDSGDMTFTFGCLFIDGFWYWGAGITCYFSETSAVVSFLSDPMEDEPDCCPVDVTFAAEDAPNPFGACCGGSVPYNIQVRVTAACP